MLLHKKIFFASIIIFLAILLFWGIYVLSFKKDATKTPTLPSMSAESPGLSFNTAGKIKTVSDEKISFPTLSSNAEAIEYYSPDLKKLQQISLEGKIGAGLSLKSWPGLSNIFWSPEKTKAILKFSGSNGQSSFSYFNFNEGKEVRLKDNLDMIVWQNEGKIAYKYYNPKTKERSLNISDPDGNNWKKLTDLEFRSVFIAPIPKTGFITYWNTANAQEETQLISITVLGADKKTLFKGKFGADYLWSSNGSKILVSHSDVQNGTKIELAVLDDKGGNYQNLGIPTFISKCVWASDNKTVYYALPANIPEGSILPNDYNAGKFNTVDTFWKIDTTTGKKERVIELSEMKDQQVDAKNLFLNDDESVLFFVNKIDGKLYRISL